MKANDHFLNTLPFDASSEGPRFTIPEESIQQEKMPNGTMNRFLKKVSQKVNLGQRPRTQHLPRYFKGQIKKPSKNADTCI